MAAGGMTLQQIAEVWNDAPPQWRADVISIMNSTPEGRNQLRWVQNYQQMSEADQEREASKPRSPAEQLAIGIGGTAATYGLGSYATELGRQLATPAQTAATSPAVESVAQSLSGSASGAAGGGGAAAIPANAIGQNIDGSFIFGSSSPGGASTASTAANALANTSTANAATSPWYAAAPGSGAEALGQNIGSGLQAIGLGPQTASSAGSALGTAIPVAGGLYSTYQLGRNAMDNKKDPMGGALAGAGLAGSLGALGLLGALGPIGWAAALGLGAAGGAGLGMIGGNKGKDQLRRDSIRRSLRDQGLVQQQGDSWTVSGIPGVDIGVEDRNQLQNVGQNIDGRSTRASWDVDFSRGGNTDNQVAALSGLAEALGYTGKGGSDVVGMLHNAAGGNDANVRSLIDKAGGHDQVYGQIHALSETGKLDKGTADAYKNALDRMFNVGAYRNQQNKGLMALGK